MDEDGRVAVLRRSVEEGDRRAGRDGAGGEADQRFDLAAADDRALADRGALRRRSRRRSVPARRSAGRRRRGGRRGRSRGRSVRAPAARRHRAWRFRGALRIRPGRSCWSGRLQRLEGGVRLRAGVRAFRPAPRRRAPAAKVAQATRRRGRAGRARFSPVVAWRGQQRLQEAAVGEDQLAVDLEPAAGAFGFGVADLVAVALVGAAEGGFGEDRGARRRRRSAAARFRSGSRSGRG